MYKVSILSFTWSNVFGIARTLFAFSTLMTLLVNPPSVLFRELSGDDSRIVCSSLLSTSLFCVLGEDKLIYSYLMSIVILIFAIVGWFPKIIAVLHWYVSFSVFASAKFIDGGEHVAALFTLLLIPISLIDPRKSQWHAPVTLYLENKPFSTSFAYFNLFFIRVQISIIYLQASIAKLLVPEWVDGTALYYWLNSNLVGLNDTAKFLLGPVLETGIVAILTWGTLLVEFMLGISLFLTKEIRAVLFYCGLALHLAIAVFMGITSFSLMMTACLLLLLWPTKAPISLSLSKPSKLSYLIKKEL